MKKVYKIDIHGNIIGLWDDFLNPISGKKIVKRASHVEFDNDYQMWRINIYVAGKKREVNTKFRDRKDALNHEVLLCNKMISGFPIESYLEPESEEIIPFDSLKDPCLKDFIFS